MPSVELSRNECQRDLLPAVCIFCGDPATSRQEKTFRQYPRWVWVLFLVHLIIHVVVAWLLTRKMQLRVPVCDVHAGYWTRRSFTVFGTFFAVAVYFIAFGIYVEARPANQGNAFLRALLLGGIILFIIWLFMTVVFSATGVRATQITNKSIRLAGVCQIFIEALEEVREREQEEWERDQQRERDDRRDDRDSSDDRRERKRPGLRSYDDYLGPSRRRDERDD